MQKENIKMIIKQKKLSEKNSSTSNKVIASKGENPLDLSYPLPISKNLSNPHYRSRSTSIESQSSIFDLSGPPPNPDYFIFNTQIQPNHLQYESILPTEYFSCEEGNKVGDEAFTSNLLNCSESSISTFTGLQLGSIPESLFSIPSEVDWNLNNLNEGPKTCDEETCQNFFDFSHSYSHSPGCIVDLSEGDQRLLDHFVSDVLPNIFPILEIHPHRSALIDHVTSALRSNKCYLHCCLSIATQHYKATMNIENEFFDDEIMRHRYDTISELCEALDRDTDHAAILEATLGMILFQGCVGRADDTLPDIPWHQHFQAAISLVQKLELHRFVEETPNQPAIPFNMTMTAWIDILGATILGRAPIFAHTYREKHLSIKNSSLGLRALMGCDDHVLYLISEIACLEVLKNEGMDDFQLCRHVHSLGDQINLTEVGDPGPASSFDSQGLLQSQQLLYNITAAFRIAARIYLCSLVPGFTPNQTSCVGLVTKLTKIIALIPSGPKGFDRSLVWVYLIGGSISTPDSSFRAFFTKRLESLWHTASYGALGRVACLLKEIWSRTDDVLSHEIQEDGESYISWRDVMQKNGWDFLLI